MITKKIRGLREKLVSSNKNYLEGEIISLRYWNIGNSFIVFSILHSGAF